MELTIVLLSLGLMFLGFFTKARAFNVGASVILLSQVFIVQDSIIIVGLIFVVLFNLYYALFAD